MLESPDSASLSLGPTEGRPVSWSKQPENSPTALKQVGRAWLLHCDGCKSSLFLPEGGEFVTHWDHMGSSGQVALVRDLEIQKSNLTKSEDRAVRSLLDWIVRQDLHLFDDAAITRVDSERAKKEARLSHAREERTVVLTAKQAEMVEEIRLVRSLAAQARVEIERAERLARAAETSNGRASGLLKDPLVEAVSGCPHCGSERQFYRICRTCRRVRWK